MNGNEQESQKLQLQQVFEFLKQWHHRNVNVPQDWKTYDWKLSLTDTDLPQHPDVNVCRSATGEDTEFVLRVTRPKETPCPRLPENLKEWLTPGWDDPKNADAKFLEARNVLIDDDTVTLRFDDESDRSVAFKTWSDKREKWRLAARPVRDTIDLFGKFFELRGRLQRESERVVLLLGEGIIRANSNSGAIHHPIFTQRVELRYEPSVPSFTVTIADDPPELNTALLRKLDGIDASQMGECRKKICEGETDLLDGANVKERCVNTLNALMGNATVLDEPASAAAEGRVLAWSQRVLILTPRVARVTDAIDATVERFKKSSELPEPVTGIVGINDTLTERPHPGNSGSSDEYREPSKSDTRRELLLTKESNTVQEQILTQLLRKKTVVVQGPPGTGKTHTIGNIVGHLLARGDRVLIASHTPKALRVLRKNIPKDLQPLCVSVLDSDADSREELRESVQGIDAKLTTTNEQSLKREADQFRRERESLIDDLEAAEKELERAVGNEYRHIVVAGDSYHPIEAAKMVRQLLEHHDWLPGPVLSGELCALSEDEIRELYRLNGEIQPDEEEDIAGDIPELGELPSPEALAKKVSRETKLLEKKLRRWDALWQHDASEDQVELKNALKLFVSALRRIENMNQHPHLKECMDAGRRGDPILGAWQHFVQYIDTQSNKIEANVAKAQQGGALIEGEPVNEALLGICQSIREALSKKGTVYKLMARFGRKLRPDWGRLIRAATVNGQDPVTDTDFAAIEAFIRTKVGRTELIQKWRTQFRTYPPNVRDFDFGERPEDTARHHLDRIKKALKWHADHWSKALEAIRNAGFILEEATTVAQPRTGRFADLDRLQETATKIVHPAISARCKQFELKEIQASIETTVSTLGCIEPERDLSGLAQVMANSLTNRDLSTYEGAYERLRLLHGQKGRFQRRRDLLSRLRPSADEWARSIEQRLSPHDAPAPPGPPETAWLCRQLVQELDKRCDTDVTSLQQRVTKLRKALLNKTTELVNRLAWATQHQQTGRNERQALQSWLQTIETRGYHSGKRSTQLKTQARKLLKQSRDAVPVWIMTIARAVENLDFKGREFDVVIIDEASQCDMLGLLLLGLAKTAIVVGDDKQVTPSAVAEPLDHTQKLIDEYLQELPNRELFTGRYSLYDLATQSFGTPQRLIEHFRCAKPIIDFCNANFYKSIRPLRDTSRVRRLPHIMEYQVLNGRREGAVNGIEANEVASLVIACIDQPEYNEATFGVISMLGQDHQALEIDRILRTRLSEARYEKAQVICGSPPQFQGDERDVIFLSLVDSAELRLKRDQLAQQRYNVAVSRAKDQLWIVHSIDDTNLKGEDLRLKLLRHARDPEAAAAQTQDIEREADSEFEILVGEALTDRGYRVRPQWPVGYMRIDLVAIGTGDRKAAIECDGEKHHGLEHLAADLERQHLLERLGWKFIRIRGSEFFRDQEATLSRVQEALNKLGVEPIGAATADDSASTTSELSERVKRRAAELRQEWNEPEMDHDGGQEVDEDLEPDLSVSADSPSS